MPTVSFDLYEFQMNQMYCGSALSLSMSFIVRIVQQAWGLETSQFRFKERLESPKLTSRLSFPTEKVKIKWEWKRNFFPSLEAYYRQVRVEGSCGGTVLLLILLFLLHGWRLESAGLPLQHFSEIVSYFERKYTFYGVAGKLEGI